MDKRFWGIIGAVVIILGAIFIITNHNKTNGSSSSASNTPTSHIEGQNADGITLVEYGDYECPFCDEYYPTVKQVEAEYDQVIRFQFRNLPLTQVHPNAEAGAKAAEAASLQGKFWQMHDLLYENQNEWVNSSTPQTVFDKYARQLGLNVTKFDQDFASNQVSDAIQADVNQFPKDFKAATGSFDPKTDIATPTFFLDGKHVQPNNTAADFEKLINAEIKKKTGKDSGIGSTSPPSTTTTTTPQQSTQSGQSTQ